MKIQAALPHEKKCNFRIPHNAYPVCAEALSIVCLVHHRLHYRYYMYFITKYISVNNTPINQYASACCNYLVELLIRATYFLLPPNQIVLNMSQHSEQVSKQTYVYR